MTATRSSPRRADRLTSGQLSEATGVSRGALRLYERERLISPPPRSEGGYRLYPEDAVDLIEAIKLVKGLGFGLEEIREMLDLFGGGDTEANLRALAARHIAAIDARVAGLRELRECLAAFAEGETFEHDEECAALARLLKRRRAAAAKPRSSH